MSELNQLNLQSNENKRLYSFTGEEARLSNPNKQINPQPQSIIEQDAFDITEFEEAIADRDQRIEKLTEDNTNLTNIIDRMTTEKIENDELYQKECIKYVKQIESLESKFKDFNEQLKKSEKLIAKYDETNRNLEMLLKGCKDDETNSNSNLNFNERINENLDSYQKIDDQANIFCYESFEKIKSNYIEKISTLERKITELESSIKNHEKEKETLNLCKITEEEIYTGAFDKERIEKENEELRQEYFEFQNEIEKNKKTIEDLLKRNKDFNQRENIYEDKIKIFEEENNELKEKQEKYEKENKELHLELDENVRKNLQYEKNIENMINEINQFKETIQNYQLEIEKKNSIINLKNSELNEKLLNQQQMEKLINNKNGELNKISEIDENIIDALLNEKEIIISEKNEKIIELNNQIQEKQKIIEKLNSKINKDQILFKNTHAKYEETLKIINENKKRISELEMNGIEYNQYLEETTEKNKLNIQRISKISDELLTLKQNLQIFKQNINKSLKETIKSMQEDLPKQIASLYTTLRTSFQAKIIAIKQNYILKETQLKKSYENEMESIRKTESVNNSRYISTNESNFVESKIKPGNRPQAYSTHINNEKRDNIFENGKKIFKKEEKIQGNFSDLKKSFLTLQDEHAKIVGIFEESLKGDKNSSKNEIILFNYFEKIFDRLSLSLEKENEIKSLILQIDEKLDNQKDKSVDNILQRKFDLLQKDLENKNDTINRLESEKIELKATCKELQIQLEFKKAQSSYFQTSSYTHDKNEKQVKKSNEMSEIYQKYLRASKNPDLKYLNKSLKDYSYDKSEIDNIIVNNVTPRTPIVQGREENKNLIRNIVDNQKTKTTKPFLKFEKRDGHSPAVKNNSFRFPGEK